MSIHSPKNLADALIHLHDDSDAIAIAGGTDLMVEINFGRRRPSSVVSLRHVNELKSWSVDEASGVVTIGSGVPYAEMEKGPLADALPALAEAARTVGSPQIRAAGTLGGNLGTCSPAGDSLPVLSALDATINLVSVNGSRSVAFNEYMIGPKKTSRQRDELVESVSIPMSDGWQGYAKVGTRNAMVISVASCCVALSSNQKSIRVALGSVGPTIIRATNSELAFSQGQLSSSEFGEMVAGEAKPIDDHRSTAQYRRHAIRVLAQRLLERGLSS
jgi:CO/xanthine dehydrogenase FAD-binding subunit